MLYRLVGLEPGLAKRAGADGTGDLVIDMSFSSETPYERWWGVEILDHSNDSVRLGRLNDGAPVLFNHNWNDLRGVHQNARVENGVGRAEVRLQSVTQEGRDAIGLVESGVLTKTSVGYSIYKVVEQTTKKSGEKIERELDGRLFERVLERAQQNNKGDIVSFRRDLDAAAGAFERSGDEPTIYRVMDWEPHENSLVTIPADVTVGVGRALENESEVRASVNPAIPATPKQEVKMTEATQAAAGVSAENISAVAAENERRSAVVALCKSYKIDSRVQNAWIEKGTALSEVAHEITKVMEERSKTEPTAASEIGLSKRETQQYSIVRALRALRWGPNDPKFMRDAAFEIDASRAVAQKIGREGSTGFLVPGEVLARPMGGDAQRAMATQPGSKGGYLVDVTNMGFIDILRNRSVAMRMGARQLSGLQGNVAFSRQTGKVSVTWQAGDGTSVTAADQALGQLSMTPKTCIAITDVSEQLLRQSSPSAEAFIMADLAADVAIDGIDNAVINGTGGAQPIGIKNTSGITSGQDAASATYAKILAFVSTAGAANAIRGNPGWVTTTAGAAKLMQVQRFTSTDTPVWTGNMLDGNLVGFTSMSSEQLASGNIIFGSWDEVVIGDWGVLELSTDNGGTRFNQAQVGIRAMWMVDVMIRYPQAFVVGTNLS